MKKFFKNLLRILNKIKLINNNITYYKYIKFKIHIIYNKL